jgi:putative protein-disulfide isomerase
MCSWCWGFRPVWQSLRERLPAEVKVVRLLGGLAPDNDEPMPEEMRRHLQQTWRRIEQRIPGTRFNFAFWERCHPRRSTYPACRALIAARLQGDEYDAPMLLAIQEAYYLQARNPSDRSTLVDLAGEIGLDSVRFSADLDSESTRQQLLREIAMARSLGLDSFPSLALETGGSRWPVAVAHSDAGAMLEQIRMLLE